jgi:RHS repeat-associated protein
MRPARPGGLARTLRALVSRRPLLLSALALLVLGSSALASGVLRLGHSSGAASEAGQDTVLVYGPKRFESGKGKPALHVERFTVTPAPGVRYTLRLQNGAADGSARASQASVKLNGLELFTAAELQRGSGVLARQVALGGENLLEVEVAGPADSYVSLSVVQTPDPTFTVHGPRTVERGTASPTRVVERFSIPATAAPPYALHLINGAADGSGRATSAVVRINGQAVLSPADLNPRVGGLILPVTLSRENTLEVELAGEPGAHLSVRLTATDTTPPQITLTAPAAGLITKALELEVSGSIQDETHTRVQVNEQAATRAGESFRAKVPLATEGENRIQVRAIDAAGNRTDSVRVVIRDTEPPVLTLSSPADGAVTRAEVVTVSGTVQDRTPVKLNVNGVPAMLDAAGAFRTQLPLTEGVNFLTIVAEDAAGNSTSQTRQVIRDTQPPVITITEPAEGQSTPEETLTVRGSVQDATAVTLTVNGQAVPLGADKTFSSVVSLAVGSNTVTVSATDAAGNQSIQTRTVTRTAAEGPLPPDPTTVAPQLDPTVATTLGSATAFLYSGSNPIQTGVAPGTIHPVRVSVLRGRVLTREGKPLPGVKVTVKDHPELGQTLSRADGAYDLAVNGGALLTLNYEKAGHLPAHRQVNAPWQDYAHVDEVALVGLDPAVTAVSFAAGTSEPQVARGSVVRDADGPRQATLIFDAGTTASLQMPDGSTKAVSSLSIRATEYTVGDNGPKAMPAPLPATSAYTYAVELSADEAIAAGATSVKFSKPVAVYLENFLKFPVGTQIPVGWLSEQQAAWVPSEDGRVIKILSTGSGVAEIDVNGDGAAESAEALAALGIDDSERKKLAQVYQPGQSLWRVQVTHFTAYDFNCPAGPPEDAEKPKNEKPKKDDKEDKNCEQPGSIIECQNQILGERLGVTGTGFSLNYRSDRVPGRTASDSLEIPISGSTVPASLKRIEVEIYVAGRAWVDTFPAQPNQKKIFVWDGKDAYGRAVQGQQWVHVRIGYVYPQQYWAPPAVARSFGLACQPADPNTPWRQACFLSSELQGPARQETTMWQEWTVTVGARDARGDGLGGWTLSVHHAYDPVGRVLYLGDGTRRSARSIDPVITTVAGNRGHGYRGDGGPATAAELGWPLHFAMGRDGSIYITDEQHYVVRRVGPDGIITTVAGNGTSCTTWTEQACGDGKPATQVQLGIPTGVAVGPDGSLYIADGTTHRIRRVGPDGIITTVAGSAQAVSWEGRGFSGDGGPATEAKLAYPLQIVFGPDGSLYIADAGNARIRRVAPGGSIMTVAGDHQQCWRRKRAGDPTCGDGGLATRATIDQLSSVAVGPDGSLYIAESSGSRIRRVTPDGVIRTVAGTGAQCSWWRDGNCGDGGPATAAKLSIPFDVDVGPDGSIYVVDRDYNSKVRRVAPDGRITSIGGTGQDCYDYTISDLSPECGGERGPATAARLHWLIGVRVGPDGNVYVLDSGMARIHKIALPLTGFVADQIAVASADGAEVYQFDATGRHLRTLNALTGATVYTFAYDARGYLTTITDGDGNVTTLQRDGAGTPLAVVGPYGDRTTLSLNGDGYLTAVSNEAGETVRLAYGQGGLLSSLMDARGNASRFTYSAGGRLLRDEDAAGGFKVLAMSQDSAGRTTSFTTALGRTSSYRVEEVPGVGSRQVNRGPDGLPIISTFKGDGSTTINSPDGMVTEIIEGPDPRVGMQAPIAKTVTVRTPGGLISKQTTVRRVTLADPNNPLSLVTQADSVFSNGRISARTYDAAQRRFTNTSPEGRRTFTRIDAQGRPLEVQAAGLLPLASSYDSRGRLVQTAHGSRSWRYVYDARGRLSGTIDPLGRKSEMYYDVTGRLARQVRPDGKEVRFTYDSNGNLTSITPAGRPAHSFGYTSVSLRDEYTPPDVGIGSTSTRYAYNLDRQLTRVIRPDGKTIDFGYDAAGRSSVVTLPHGRIAYQYSASTGQLTGVTAPDGGTLAFTYDGSLPTRVAWGGAVAGTVGVTYNNDFRVASQIVNGSDTIRFQYDRDGLLTGAGALAISRSAESGFLTGSTLGSVSGSQGYDGYGALTEAKFSFGSTSLFQTAYLRDEIGRITQLTETAAGETNVYRYAYDAVGRLIEVRKNGTPVESYEYDANGNRVRYTGPNGSVAGTYDDQDRLLRYGDATYAYTANGELERKVVGGDTTRYDYDVLGNLRSVVLPGAKRIEYVVDAQNRRIGKRVNGTLTQGFLYGDQLKVVAELDGSGSVASRFVYATKANVPDYMVRGGKTYRMVSDHLGSVRQVVEVSTGAVAQRIDYDAFGRIIRDTSPGFQPFGFAGGLYDPDTQLTRFGARDYDAYAGRWTSKDPIGFGGGDPNLYGYVLGDPVNLVDPNGKNPAAIVGAIIGAIAGAAGSAAAGGGYGDMAQGAILGGVAGGLAGLIPGGATLAEAIYSNLLGSMIAAALANAAGQGFSLECSQDFDVESYLLSALAGALGGMGTGFLAYITRSGGLAAAIGGMLGGTLDTFFQGINKPNEGSRCPTDCPE